MWTQDDFPGASHVPWQLLIRARFAHEIDAVIASSVVQAVSQVAGKDLTVTVARLAADAVQASKREGGEATAQMRIVAGTALDDWDGGICPPPRPWPWPPYWRSGWAEDIGDPIAPVLLSRALDLVDAAGSEQLQRNLGEPLRELSR